jgi:hypothetical protein
LHLLDEESRNSRWRLEASVCHKVDDCVVALVSDTGENGKWELCYVGSEQVGFEAVQIARSPSSTKDGHAVPLFVLGGNGVERGNDTHFYI